MNNPTNSFFGNSGTGGNLLDSNSGHCVTVGYVNSNTSIQSEIEDIEGNIRESILDMGDLILLHTVIGFKISLDDYNKVKDLPTFKDLMKEIRNSMFPENKLDEIKNKLKILDIIKE